MLFPCRQQRQVVSEVAFLLPGVDPRLWRSFAYPCRASLGGKRELGGKHQARQRCSAPSTRKHNSASSSQKLHAPPEKLLASQLFSPVPTESMAAGHSRVTRQLDSQSSVARWINFPR
ncbi:unnamed protein product [Ectocarpus sp. 12 AP-2014]